MPSHAFHNIISIITSARSDLKRLAYFLLRGSLLTHAELGAISYNRTIMPFFQAERFKRI